MSFLGIDLGTSGAKLLVIDGQGKILAQSYRSYPILTPQLTWNEQKPSDWWNAVVEMLAEISTQTPLKEIETISFSGQMHGLVMVNERGESLSRAIIWSDQRSASQCERIDKMMGSERVHDLTGLPTYPGFLGTSLLWVKENEPEIFRDIHKVFLPKDFLKFKLTGEFSTDHSDASSTLLYDIGKREWSHEILRKIGIPPSLLPEILSSEKVCGVVSDEAAEETGLAPGTLVTAGGGDQAVTALSNGLIEEGEVSCTIGTGGQLLTCLDRPIVDRRLHTFAHCLSGKWLLMGATLSAGLSLRWFKENILRTQESFSELEEEASKIEPGSGGLLFLPYLVGERSPHMDPAAKGVFFGLSLSHTRAHMLRAIMEGVVFALRESLDIFEEKGIKVERVIACGGGAKSLLWRQIQADVFQKEIVTTQMEEQAAYGAALLARWGSNNREELSASTDRYKDKTCPDSKNTRHYEGSYSIYRELYLRLREKFAC